MTCNGKSIKDIAQLSGRNHKRHFCLPIPNHHDPKTLLKEQLILNTKYSGFSNWEAEKMATMTVRMNDSDAELVRKFAAFEGMTISDFARTAIMEKIEDAYDLQELRSAIAEDTGERFSIDQILDELS
ncbi:type II toxin-antitoxin system RelB family antitoxin [Corynebacterium hindlerae]|uniref:type II toxin-antitoxin system RelB family antitoxin n=1 Tax=Corynebacterium hindlerae TaxID=699041 RepID=UPI001FCB36A7|nr:DUF6290 family protein [Corynebacterium hindlerae]